MIKRVVSAILFCASFLLAQTYELKTPQNSVEAYYKAINSADISLLQSVMTPASFDADMQIYALSIALNDKVFHQQLKAYNKTAQAKSSVIKKVEEKLQHRQARSIVINEVTTLGTDRAMVRFYEDGKKKQLYLSQQNKQWIIDYQAGRRR
jgi:hypothetical protein